MHIVIKCINKYLNIYIMVFKTDYSITIQIYFINVNIIYNNNININNKSN